mgnify:CR=1 FL=1
MLCSRVFTLRLFLYKLIMLDIVECNGECNGYYAVICDKTQSVECYIHAIRLQEPYPIYIVSSVLHTTIKPCELIMIECLLLPFHSEIIAIDELTTIEKMVTVFDMIRNKNESMYEFMDRFIFTNNLHWDYTIMTLIFLYLKSNYTLPKNGIVRQMWYDGTINHFHHPNMCDYVHLDDENKPCSMSNIFDRGDYHILLSGNDPAKVYGSIPEKYRKPLMLHLMNKSEWNVHFNNTQNNVHSYPWIRVVVTMFVVDEEVIDEKSTTYERGIYKIYPNGTILLEKPVVFVFNHEDTVYFECKINETCTSVNKNLEIQYKSLPFTDSQIMTGIVKFIRVKPCILYELFRKHVSAKKIQRIWAKCITNPSHKMCRKRLNEEFADLMDGMI